ncbi:beta-ribofuranosylaminobenzene 5'-phosphate synthase family protein [Pyrodictium delaneyi]|uniref:Beta-ribofuranosylaminobenzene 5'-phosphate synthase n=1 Tax=Pyrodictium delaneyi TaxID=1273541 RepID=A0A211YM84_9CREN|nr:beta-ribofuranosylaminobenzene 5'-phosphate synthase family protein [Pyrodictium delaneyi]OWJ54168.1 hypothetical protein Pdsh_10005 [Pyrodictium delaneyi]
MPERVIVSTPAHLHAGNMDLHGGLGRLYGTVGFTVSQPRLVLEAWRCPDTRVEGADADRALQIVDRLQEEFGLPHICIRIHEAIPRHVGMGSTTSLVLSIARAYQLLYSAGVGLADAALALGRSTVSALGFYSFTRGGMIVEGGFLLEEKGRHIPPLIARYELPESWRFVIAIPYEPLPRILELKAREDEVLESMPSMPEEMAMKASRIVLMKLMPAAAEARLEELLEALEEFNGLLGEYWATEQKGRYCCPLVEEGIRLLHSLGSAGAAQSSWGPTFYTIAPSLSKAKAIASRLREWLSERGGGAVYIAAPDNHGATVIV